MNKFKKAIATIGIASVLAIGATTLSATPAVPATNRPWDA